MMDGGSESLQISPEVACVSGFNFGNCGWAPQNSQLACCVAVNSSRRCILTVRSPNFLPLDRGRSEIRLVPPANDEERHVPLAQRRSSFVLADLPPDFVRTVLDSAEDPDKHAWSLAWMSKEAQLSTHIPRIPAHRPGSPPDDQIENLLQARQLHYDSRQDGLHWLQQGSPPRDAWSSPPRRHPPVVFTHNTPQHDTQHASARHWHLLPTESLPRRRARYVGGSTPRMALYQGLPLPALIFISAYLQAVGYIRPSI